MGTKTFTLFICWVAVNGHLVSSENVVKKSGINDNISAESVSRLYHNVPVDVYASATPYGAYSFHVPSFVSPKNVPVKEESGTIANTNRYLKDSYGNQFVDGSQPFSYRSTLPQQFVQLQNLPAHLSQPLVSPTLQFKQLTPHFFAPGQYSVQNIQGASPTGSRYTVQQPLGYGNLQSFAPNSVLYTQLQPQLALQQSSNNNNIIYSAVNAANNNNIKSEAKYQGLQEVPHVTFASNEKSSINQHPVQTSQLQHLQQVPKQTTITTLANGKKISVNLVTKPPLPLLDLSLLEPLTFSNPLVPQVQHYLPRINQATYYKLPNANIEQKKNNQMEFIVQNTNTYSSDDKPKQTNVSSKKKQKKVQKHQTIISDDKEISSPPRTSTKEAPKPEISYEISSPNYKETYTEKKISYNKETESEPKIYNYEMKIENKPMHYSYEKTTQKKPADHLSYDHKVEKAPIEYNYEEQNQEVPLHYSKSSKKPVSFEHQNQNPKHLVYTLKTDERDTYERAEQGNRHHPSENSDESSEVDNKKEDDEQRSKNHGHHVHYVESPESIHYSPEHGHVQYYHSTNQEDPKLGQHHNTHQSFVRVHKDTIPIQHVQQYFQPIVPEYEEDITILPQHKHHESIRVNPNQHNIQINKNSPALSQNNPATYDHPASLYASAPIIKGKPKQVRGKEELETAQDENNGVLTNMFKEQENNEENFEKSYKDAAYGFAAYDAPRVDSEKEIFNPDSYGVPRYYSEYNIAKSPLKQYEAEGDKFPKFSRLNYKDTRDKMQEDYYLDYAVSRPESLRDRYRNKEGYYRLFKKQRPDYIIEHEDEDDNTQKAKYTSMPSYEYKPDQKQTQHYTRHKINSDESEYDYSNEQPRDASAHATRPHHRYKSKTHFVEPQFQYGFEPISIPQLLDSELAAMASNETPKSEKQGTRKKIYKETVFIKKPSTTGAKRKS